MLKKTMAIVFALTLPFAASAQDANKPDFISDEDWAKIVNRPEAPTRAWRCRMARRSAFDLRLDGRRLPGGGVEPREGPA